ncbi:MAG TPA: AAA family ATPase [Streptosporangiaceae bacterium]|nr:AAA family ATPase [Streptosporangiaceae bacterium]
MRLLCIDIEEFRAISNQRIPAEGLVVLFGANSAGKTSVLEAAENLITQALSVRVDPGSREEPYVLGSIWFELPAADVAASQDAQLYASMLRSELLKPDLFDEPPEFPWKWLEGPARRRLVDADLPEARAILADALARAGDAGGAEDRLLLATSVFDPAAIYFVAGLISTSLNLYGQSLKADIRRAAKRIAAFTADDPLSQLAQKLVADGWVHVGWVVDGASSWEGLAEAFPPVIVLAGDIESLSAELEDAVVAVHDRLWSFPPEVVGSFPGGQLVNAQFFPIGERDEGPRYAVDQWLETMSDDGQVELPDIFDRYDKGDWHRVRRSILAAAGLLAAEANQLAPGFVKDQGTIGIEVLPVSVWGSGRPRVRATFTATRDEKRDLNVLGAGTARWAAAALRLAARRLAQARQVILDTTGAPVMDENEICRIVTDAYRDPLNQTAVRLEPSDAPAVYIADEPEAHLHPAALRSVARWLSNLSRTAALVLTATHSTMLLDSPAELIHRVLVQPAEQGTQLRLMTGSIDEELSRVSDSLGLSKGELLLLTRLALFVEGPNDQLILREWFGDELRAAGIRVFPVHGVDNLPGLATSEVVTALGIRIATLSDDTDVSRARSARVRTTGEGAVARLIAETTRLGTAVHIVGLEQPDILYYLNEDICRKTAPDFPGWDTAVSE